MKLSPTVSELPEYERPRLYPKQKAAFFNKARIACCEASTKSGKTHGGMVWLYEKALLEGGPGKSYWWVAPVYPQAKIAYRRLKLAIPEALRICNDSEMTITVKSGSPIYFKSSEKPDNLYGEDVYAGVIDEASRTREESFFAIRSTLTATRGPLRIIGNVKGSRNWFYKLARKAESGEPGYHYSKITASDAVRAGVLAADEIEGAKRDLPESVFKELYLAEPSEDGSNPFGFAHIKRCTSPTISTELPIGYGIDLAKSVDWTVVIGLDAEMAVCNFQRFQKPWEDTIASIHEFVGKRSALVDSTGVGDAVLESLQRGGNSTRYEGFKFSSSSKQQLMEGLAVAIQQQGVSFPDGPIRHELEAFEYEYTRTGVRYSAPQGMHDDCVVALALAVKKCSVNAGIKPQSVVVRGGRASGPKSNPGRPGYYERSRY